MRQLYGSYFRKILIGLLTVCLCLFAAPTAQAAVVTWYNTGKDWNTAANWNSGAGPVPTAADIATFAAAMAANPNLSLAATVSGLNFSTATSSGYTISSSGPALTLMSTATGTGTAAITNQITAGTNTISANIILGGAAGTSARFIQNTGGELALSGNISSTNAITGVNYQPQNNNASSVFTISGNNTYNGTTTLGFCTFNVNSTTAFSSGTVIFSNNPRFNNTSGAR